MKQINETEQQHIRRLLGKRRYRSLYEEMLPPPKERRSQYVQTEEFAERLASLDVENTRNNYRKLGSAEENRLDGHLYPDTEDTPEWLENYSTDRPLTDVEKDMGPSWGFDDE